MKISIPVRAQHELYIFRTGRMEIYMYIDIVLRKIIVDVCQIYI